MSSSLLYKKKILLKKGTPELYGTVTITVSVDKLTEQVAAAVGVGKQELDNLLNQTMQEVVALTGNSDEL